MEHKQSWYIPRPSLSSNSSSTNTNKSHDSIRCYHRDSEVIDIERSKGKKNSTKNAATTSSSSSSSISSHRSKNQPQMETCIDGDSDSPKRGSRSSQGSSDSEQSIHVRFFSGFSLSNDRWTASQSLLSERFISSSNRCEFRKLCQNSRTIASSIVNPCQTSQQIYHQHSSE